MEADVDELKPGDLVTLVPSTGKHRGMQLVCNFMKHCTTPRGKPAITVGNICECCAVVQKTFATTSVVIESVRRRQ